MENVEKVNKKINDVYDQIEIQEENLGKKMKGIASVVKFDVNYKMFNEEAYPFIYKHPYEDFNSLTQLIVHESQEAIFMMNGEMLDTFGPGRYTLETQNIPKIGGFLKKATERAPVDRVKGLFSKHTDENNPFHCEVYFINKNERMAIKWGTDSKVQYIDPKYNIPLEVGASGEMSLRIENGRKTLLKLVGTNKSFNQNDLKKYFRALLMTKVKPYIASYLSNPSVSIFTVDQNIDEFSKSLKESLSPNFEEYGIALENFYVTTILKPEEDSNYLKIKQQFADKTLKVRDEEILQAEAEAAQKRKVVEAQTEAQLKMVQAQAEAEMLKVKAQAEAEAIKLAGMAEAEIMHAKGYSYQQETQREVAKEAMKNGITGTGSGGGNTIGDLAGLGVALGAAGGIASMAKDMITPAMQAANGVGQAVTSVNSGSWNCECGTQNITSNFCPNCGKSRPVPSTWNCECGTQNITSNFCPNCGKKRP